VRKTSASILLIAVATLLFSAAAHAQTFTTLYSFTGGSDGAAPLAGVAQDRAGNLYGTTFEGGNVNCGNYGDGCGVVYEIGSGGTETSLHIFCQQGCADGANPRATVIRDEAGNLYGTTYEGGSGDDAFGTVFKIDSAGNEAVLHTFSGPGGCLPVQGLLLGESGSMFGTSGSVVSDKSGNFYGTTYGCGSSNFGTIWKVSSKGKETILHNFAWGKSDGCEPLAGLTMGQRGTFYGVTASCGANGYGVLYELSREGELTLLHNFDASDGAEPLGEVLRTDKGTLFGTTSLGGTYGAGTVWKYVPNSQP
jgi:uncharacterized repeat protein (TIGR03803 family)